MFVIDSNRKKQNPETGKNGMHYVPYVIEPAAGATRSVLMFLSLMALDIPPAQKEEADN